MSGPGPAGEAAGTVLEKPPPPEPDDAAGAGPRRFWSARRIPAGLLALLLLVIVAAFLYDIAAVRADRPAMSWRRELADQLARRPLDDFWVLLGAGVAALLGLWLLLLALTPGLRSLLPMHRTRPDVRAGLDRDAAATVLRDRAVGVAGVRSVRVRVTRKRADVRAVSHFRELDDVRADLRAVLDDAVRGMALSRPPVPAVRVRRPGRKG
ncbi:DUF6286 domain-containing protein [Streptomyces sp. QTS137]